MSPQERFLSPQNKLHLPPLSSFSFMKPESPRISLPQANRKTSNGTPRSRRQCHCKQSKCLKLYCECFASGSYCDGFSCADCHNNVENEDVRKKTTECILERNPYAFKPKITGSPCSPLVDGDVAKDVLVMAKHIKGCLKELVASKSIVSAFKQTFPALKIANVSTARIWKDVTWEWLFPGKIMVRPMPTFCRKALLHLILFYPPVISSLKNPGKENFENYLIQTRKTQKFMSSQNIIWSLLANAIHPLDTREFCSLLLVVSEAANFLADKTCKAGIKEVKEYQMACDLEKECKNEPDAQQLVSHYQFPGSQTDITDMDNSRSSDIGLQDGGPFAPEGYDLMCDEKDKSFTISTSLD